MPVRSLSSSVFRWPDAKSVNGAVRRWVDERAQERADILRVGYIGSYARGDWGVGSDLDLIIVVEKSAQPFWRRPLDWDITSLPVPTDLIIYTLEEWHELTTQGGRFYGTIAREAVWVYVKRIERRQEDR
jgi:hypothetical protein